VTQITSSGDAEYRDRPLSGLYRKQKGKGGGP